MSDNYDFSQHKSDDKQADETRLSVYIIKDGDIDLSL